MSTKDHHDLLIVVGINSKGFGTFPKMISKDRRITPESKGIYGYIASYAGAGTTAFPSLEMILKDMGMTAKRFYVHFNLLTQYGYITVTKERSTKKDKKGTWEHNVYHLNTRITNPYEDEEPLSQNDLVVSPRMEDSPLSQNDLVVPLSQNDHMDQPLSRFDQANTEGIIRPFVPYGLNSVNTIKCISPSVRLSIKKTDRRTDELKDIEDLKKIQAVLDDESLKDPNVVSASFLKSIRGYIRDLYFKTNFVVDNSTIPKSLVRETLRELTPECIEHTYKKIEEYSREKGIRNPKQYTQAVLYNSVNDEPVSMTTEINYKIHGNGRKSN